MKELGENLRLERVKYNISQKKLGEMMDLTQQAIAKWEKGLAEPDSKNLILLSNLYNVTIDYLMGKTQEIIQKESVENSTDPIELIFSKNGISREMWDNLSESKKLLVFSIIKELKNDN